MKNTLVFVAIDILGIGASWFFAMQASTTTLEGMRVWYMCASIVSVGAVPFIGMGLTL